MVPAASLGRRMEEVRANEVSSTLEDLMYVSILEKFLLLKVDMLPRMDGEITASLRRAHLPVLSDKLHGLHTESSCVGASLLRQPIAILTLCISF